MANYDDELADEFLEGKGADEISEALIHQAVFEAVNFHGTVGLYCGSALKNKGIQPLIEGAIRYIPSPENVRPLATDKKDGTTVTLEAVKKKPLRALAFKVVSDKEKGMITFFRVYQGILKNRQKLMITNLKEVERVQSLMRVRADEMQLLEGIGAGDIGAIVGLKAVRSGDTIVDEQDRNAHSLQMLGVTVPTPVFFCSIEPEQTRQKSELNQILRDLSREDPSLNVQEDEETGQVLVSGLGELHLEILRDRIELEHGIKAELGRMRVAYRESVVESAEDEIELEKTIGGAHMYCKLRIRIESSLDEVDMTEI